ncbi:MAG: restriction endonuclease subunit S [Clostridia bacterium]|nr:restriction endonuclease subunit S [Clostridia bacterium]
MTSMKLSNCVDIVGGAVSPFSGKRFYLSTGTLKGDIIDESELVEVTYDNRPSRANVNVSVGDIIFAKMKSTIKVLRITSKEQNFIVSTGFYAIRPHSDVDSDFIVQYLLSDAFNVQKDKYCTGATQKALTNTGFAKIDVPKLSLDSQRQIGYTLSLAASAIRKRYEQLAILDKLEIDSFVEMFGDPLINPHGWEKCALGSKCDIVTGNTPPRANPNYYGDFLEWIKSDNINTNGTYLTTAVEYLSEEGAARGRFVDKGSILMTCIAGSLSCIGNVAIADRRVAFNQQINAIVPRDGIETNFLYFLFRLTKSYIQGDVNMSLKGIVNKGKLSAMSFIFPPTELQKEYSEKVELIEGQKKLLKRSLSYLKETYQATLQKAFNGELFQ